MVFGIDKRPRKCFNSKENLTKRKRKGERERESSNWIMIFVKL